MVLPLDPSRTRRPHAGRAIAAAHAGVGHHLLRRRGCAVPRTAAPQTVADSGRVPTARARCRRVTARREGARGRTVWRTGREVVRSRGRGAKWCRRPRPSGTPLTSSDAAWARWSCRSWATPPRASLHFTAAPPMIGSSGRVREPRCDREPGGSLASPERPPLSGDSMSLSSPRRLCRRGCGSCRRRPTPCHRRRRESNWRPPVRRPR